VHEAGLEQPALVVALLGPGVGEVDVDARERGFWKLVSRIFPENTPSLRLHERCGFRVVGIYQRHGKLEGQWRDCVIVERLLEP
jgi:phosphinothricin acetyltransferase